MPDLPPEAITAAALVLADAEGDEGTYRALADDVLRAAAPAIRAAERERVYAELGNDHHVIFTEDRWTVEHSVECRLSGHMHECAYHAAVAAVADEPRPEMAGRWRIAGIDAAGLPILTPADPSGDPDD